MLTILMCAVLLSILVYVNEKEITPAIFCFIIGGLIGVIIAMILPADTKTEVKTYKLERIGKSYVTDVSEGYAVMWGSNVTVLSSNTEIKETNQESSIIVKRIIKDDTTWNYFTIDGNNTEYIIQLKIL